MSKTLPRAKTVEVAVGSNAQEKDPKSEAKNEGEVRAVVAVEDRQKEGRWTNQPDVWKEREAKAQVAKDELEEWTTPLAAPRASKKEGRQLQQDNLANWHWTISWGMYTAQTVLFATSPSRWGYNQELLNPVEIILSAQIVASR